MVDMIIKGGMVLTSEGFIEGAVAVDNGLITFVGKNANEKAEQVIDAKGCAVMPGLINAHTHLAMTLFRGFADGLPYKDWIGRIQKVEAKLTPRDVRAGAYLGALEMIKTGTTSFADMYIYMDEVAKVVEETGLRASLGFGMIEGNEDSDKKLRKRGDFVRKWGGAAGGRIMPMYAPHSVLSCSREFLIKVKERAKKDNVRIHIHVLETEDELNLMKRRYGMCSIKFLNSIGFLSKDVLAAHCVWLSDDDIGLMNDKNVNVAHCPSSNMALGVGIAPVPKMLEKGINVALGTDSAASSGSLDMWKELRCVSYLHKQKDPKTMPSSKVLEMATGNGAKALGIKAGVLAPGYLADIIVIDIKKPFFASSNLCSALVHSASGCDVKTTIVDGKILMEDYKVKLDEERIIEDARDAIIV